jgi:putative FmdB family regulatory protein
MPVYSYECQACGATTDHVVPYSSRLEPLDCPECKSPEGAQYVAVRGKITTTMNAVRPRKDDGRMIFDEREVHSDSELGADWRDEGTNRRPGGAGQKLYFHD